MLGMLKVFGRLGGVLALILLIAALLKQLVALVGFLIVAIKVGVVVIFVALIVLIGLAIWRERCNRRRERNEF
jgi:hypothetical protein